MPGGRYQPVVPMGGPQPLLWLAWVCAAESYYNVLNKGIGLESDQLCALKLPA